MDVGSDLGDANCHLNFACFFFLFCSVPQISGLVVFVAPGVNKRRWWCCCGVWQVKWSFHKKAGPVLHFPDRPQH